jgi:hypothetical protein
LKNPIALGSRLIAFIVWFDIKTKIVLKLHDQLNHSSSSLLFLFAHLGCALISISAEPAGSTTMDHTGSRKKLSLQQRELDPEQREMAFDLHQTNWGDEKSYIQPTPQNPNSGELDRKKLDIATERIARLVCKSVN